MMGNKHIYGLIFISILFLFIGNRLKNLSHDNSADSVDKVLEQYSNEKMKLSSDKENNAKGSKNSKKVSKSSKIIQIERKKEIVNKNLTSMKNKLLGKFHSEEDFKELFNRSRAIFGDSRAANSIATWSALGLRGDDSAAFSEVMSNAIHKLNENPTESFLLIKNNMKKLSDGNSDIRSSIYSAVNLLNIDKEDKKDFYGHEIGQGVELTDDGELTGTGEARRHAFAYFHKLNPSKDKVLELAQKSIESSPNNASRIDTIDRFKAYFPDLEDEINEIEK